jgi:amino acid transporter
VLVALVAIAFLGNTLSQFSRAHPSTGGFITFIGKSFGGTSAVTTALLCGAG